MQNREREDAARRVNGEVERLLDEQAFYRIATERERQAENVRRAAEAGGRTLEPWREFALNALDKHLSAVGLEKSDKHSLSEQISWLDPKEGHEKREQIIVSALREAVFSESGYRSVSEGRAGVWHELKESERLAVLQRADWVETLVEGVKPRFVHIEDSSFSNGGYISEDDILFVSREYVLGEESSPWHAMTTLFHEQRHRVQLAACADSHYHREIGVVKRAMLRYNDSHYASPGDSDRQMRKYRNQPMEVDAREHAEIRRDKVYGI